MTTITIVAEQLSDRALAAVLPSTGVLSVTVGQNLSPRRDERATQIVHGFCNPARFAPSVRIDLVVDDDAVGTVLDSLSFAYGAGVFSDAEAWVGMPAAARAA